MSKFEKFRGVISGDRGQSGNLNFSRDLPASYTVREQKMCERCGRTFYREVGSKQDFCSKNYGRRAA